MTATRYAAPTDIPEADLPESPLPYPTVLTEYATRARLAARRGLYWNQLDRNREGRLPRLGLGTTVPAVRRCMKVNTTAEMSRVEWGMHKAAYDEWERLGDPGVIGWAFTFEGVNLLADIVASVQPGHQVLRIQLAGY